MRILVVEDDTLIGMDLVMLLEDWGFTASGPCATVDKGLRAVAEAPPDLALLDVNLGRDQTSLPIAEALHAAGIPFVFLTGYNRTRFADNEIVAGAEVLRKPVADRELRRVVEEHLATAEDRRAGASRG